MPDTPTLLVCDGKAIVTTLTVAEHFNRKHQHVLEAIKNLQCSDEFRLSNFRQSSYLNEQDKVTPMFNLTRDGFTFLVMGFTGRKAAGWKEKYITAFNLMELELEKQKIAVVPQLTQLEILRASCDILIAHDKRIAHVENEVVEVKQELSNVRNLLETGTTRSDYYTAKAYCNVFNLSQKGNPDLFKSLGRIASAICRKADISIESVPDPTWGTVGSYPVAVLHRARLALHI